jgi:hypothetical protein
MHGVGCVQFSEPAAGSDCDRHGLTARRLGSDSESDASA